MRLAVSIAFLGGCFALAIAMSFGLHWIDVDSHRAECIPIGEPMSTLAYFVIVFPVLTLCTLAPTLLALVRRHIRF